MKTKAVILSLAALLLASCGGGDNSPKNAQSPEGANLQANVTNAHDQALADAQKKVLAANLSASKVMNQNANDNLNLAWASLGYDQQQALMAEEKAWLRQRQANCNLQGLQASPTDKAMQQDARLRCDTDMTNARLVILNKMRVPNDAPPTQPDKE